MVLNTVLLAGVTLSCVLPILHILALSLSGSIAGMAGVVGLVPVGFTVESYVYLIEKRDFFHSFFVSLFRVGVGGALSMALTLLCAYPLSKPAYKFPQRKYYMIFFAVTLFIGGGLIPTYMVIKSLKLLNSYWVLILPCAMNVWNVILMMNFFRSIPPAMDEASVMDGAGQWTVLVRVYLPMSLPALATLTLFTAIFLWNAWFDGIIYLNEPRKYPLASFLATQLLNKNKILSNMTTEQLALLNRLSDKSLRSAQLFLAMTPILLVYPFLQRFFIKGIVVGSVKE
jgi:putative aldouronate transport system permease protein